MIHIVGILLLGYGVVHHLVEIERTRSAHLLSDSTQQGGSGVGQIVEPRGFDNCQGYAVTSQVTYFFVIILRIVLEDIQIIVELMVDDLGIEIIRLDKHIWNDKVEGSSHIRNLCW